MHFLNVVPHVELDMLTGLEFAIQVSNTSCLCLLPLTSLSYPSFLFLNVFAILHVKRNVVLLFFCITATIGVK